MGALNLGEKRLPTGFLSQFLVLGALEPDGTVRLVGTPRRGDARFFDCIESLRYSIGLVPCGMIHANHG